MKTWIKASFGLVAAVVAVFAVIAVFVAHNTSALMVAEAEHTVKSVVRATAGQIDKLMDSVETAVANSAWLIGERLNDPDSLYAVTSNLVANNTYVVGSAVAFEPGYFPSKGRLFSPYTCRDEKGGVKSFSLTKSSEGTFYYDQSWYADAVKAGKSIWSEPYFDDGGANILMSTYSRPIRDAQGRIIAVFTADLSLAQLTAHVAAICPFPGSYAVMSSALGAPIVTPPRGVRVKGEMLTIRDKADNGWTIEITCPTDTILEGARKLIARIVMFSVLSLGLIFLVAWVYSLRLERSAALRERMESELITARNIQCNLLPREFPDNIAGALRPAREVGGDLYDFIQVGDTVYFIIGDASGKGVPAALFSFMAGTVFRMACGMNLDPGEITERINAALERGNDMCMFVTTFVGALDLKTGRLDYCCAGHNPPVIVTPDGRASFLSVKRNPPTGVVRGRSYEMQAVDLEQGAKILVYTDGVTEAERADAAQFGNDRLLRFASGCGSSDVRAVTSGLLSSVDAFVKGAPQSDDITVMAIRCASPANANLGRRTE